MIPLAFLAIAGGAILASAGITDSTIPSVAQGRPDHAGPHLAAEASSSTGSPAAISKAFGEGSGPWQHVLKEIAHREGWSAADWEQVVQMESSGNPKAVNPKSGAFGLGQFLGSTLKAYAPFGATSTNPVQQIKAMGKYIKDRYGTPTKALEHEKANGWY